MVAEVRFGGALRWVERGRVGRWAFTLLFAASLCSLAIPAEARSPEEDARLWFGATLALPIQDLATASLTVQPRFSDDISELERVLIRPSLSRALGHGFSAALGYDAHLIENPSDSVEHRAWQQLAHGVELAGIGIENRFRLEQRILENTDGAAVRLRYLLGGRLPLFGTDFDGILSNEVFIDFNSINRGPKSGFGENRSFAGIGRALGRGVSAQAGYMLHFLDLRRRNAANHTVVLGVRWAPELSR